MSTAGTRAQAKRNTILGQIAALAFAGVAVAAIIVGVPGVTMPEASVQKISDVIAERKAERDRVENAKVVDEQNLAREVNLAAVAERFGMIHSVVKPIEVIPDENHQTEVVVDDSSGIELKYLGHISEPNRQLALISFDGRQRIVPVGQSVRFTPEGQDPVSITITGVSSTEVKYERDGQSRRMAKAPKVAGSVTQVVTAAGAGASPGNPPSVDPKPSAIDPNESDLDRRRREAMERRQRIIDQQNERERGNAPTPSSRPDREN